MADLMGKMRAALEPDVFALYQQAIDLGHQLLLLDPAHTLTLSALAYAEAVLHTDHHQADALPRAQEALSKAMQHAAEENEYRVAAKALVAYATQHANEGLADISAILQKRG